MNGIWAFSSMPIYDYSSDKKTQKVRQAAKELTGAAIDGVGAGAASPIRPLTSPRPPPLDPVISSAPLQPHALSKDDTFDFLGPAIDGPPSTESIRAFRRQMRRTSVLDKHQSQHTNSSGSSSHRSSATSGEPRQPSWEQGSEGITLSRKSSGRSTTSSMQQTRERPESVQIFGKTLFNRRGKGLGLRRETSAPNSSGSSIYSPDVSEPVPALPTAASAKETSSGLGIFGRRRTTSKSDVNAAADAAAVQRKYQISGPYNFQHMTHTNTEHSPEVQRSSRMASVFEFNELRLSDAQQQQQHQVASDLPRGRHPESLYHIEDYPSEAPSIPEEGGEEGFLYRNESQVRMHHSRPPSAMHSQTSPRRLMLQHTRSQEQLRGGQPPPRPPRSPIQPEYSYLPPTAPPRMSSRMSHRHDQSVDLDRPKTSGGFQLPQPFGFSDAITSPTMPNEALSISDGPRSPDYFGMRVASPSDDSNWPLPTPTIYENEVFEKALPGVPEEERLDRAGRASVISNSSLRASQSVPLLRQFSLAQSPPTKSHAHRASGASDTLGRFDLLAAQRALRAATVERQDSDATIRERDSWEDVIDYCYEHEAEADCDFAWERSSLDISRETGAESTTPVEGDRRLNPSVEVSPAMLTPGQFEVPSLSPCSQVSAATFNEAVTPTGLLAPRTSNFSLPRAESRQSRPFLHARKSSDASSFKESHGFTLSPSLLIPSDFQQHMMAHDTEERHNLSFLVPYEEPTLTMDKSALFVYPRTSASTTGSGSNDTDRSSSSERHISATSASTDFTRLTMSTSSLDIDNFIAKPDFEEPAAVEEPAAPLVHVRTKSQGTMPSLPETEEAPPFDPSLLRRGDATHASDPNLLSLASGQVVPKGKTPPQLRRRARTASLSTPPPPGQYALFPSVQMSGNRI